MGKNKKKEYHGYGKNRYAVRDLTIAVQRKLYREYGCGVHLGMKGGGMLVYWSLIRCIPEFSGTYYQDAFRAYLQNSGPRGCRKQAPTYPPLGVFVPGPSKVNLPTPIEYQQAHEPTPKRKKAFFGDPFLDSYEWRSLRMRVLIKFGRRCMCCGATPSDGVKMHVDHVKPRKTHPELALDESNLQVLCEVCNHGKGNWTTTDFRPTDPIPPDEQKH